jgi:hypothetical protein
MNQVGDCERTARPRHLRAPVGSGCPATEAQRSAPAPSPNLAKERFQAGARTAVPYATALLLLSVAFGDVARHAGLAGWAAIVMSVLVFSDTA